jgi:small subunit ribosomal protein S13
MKIKSSIKRPSKWRANCSSKRAVVSNQQERTSSKSTTRLIIFLDIYMRVLGITIPDNKRLERGLTVLYGIGLSRSQKMLEEAKIDKNKKAKDLTEAEENSLRKLIEGFTLEGDLKREVVGNIKRLKDINSYRGSRHAKRMPARGQRTKTNSRTVRGNVRNTMGSGRTKVEKK